MNTTCVPVTEALFILPLYMLRVFREHIKLVSRWRGATFCCSLLLKQLEMVPERVQVMHLFSAREVDVTDLSRRPNLGFVQLRQCVSLLENGPEKGLRPGAFLASLGIFGSVTRQWPVGVFAVKLLVMHSSREATCVSVSLSSAIAGSGSKPRGISAPSAVRAYFRFLFF